MDMKRKREVNAFKKILDELKKIYPKKESRIFVKFIIWYDTQNHVPKGKWYIGTTCFWTFFIDPTYHTVVEKLLKKYGFNVKNVILTQVGVHALKGRILKNKQFIKLL